MLKCCPKCGSNKITVWDSPNTKLIENSDEDDLILDGTFDYWAECDDCDFNGGIVKPTKQEAIDAWNEIER